MVNELIIGNKGTLSTNFHAKAYYISFDTNEMEEFRNTPPVHGIKRHQMAFHSKTTTARSLDFAAYLTKCGSRWQHCGGSAQINLRPHPNRFSQFGRDLLLPHKFFLYLCELATTAGT